MPAGARPRPRRAGRPAAARRARPAPPRPAAAGRRRAPGRSGTRAVPRPRPASGARLPRLLLGTGGQSAGLRGASRAALRDLARLLVGRPAPVHLLRAQRQQHGLPRQVAGAGGARPRRARGAARRPGLRGGGQHPRHRVFQLPASAAGRGRPAAPHLLRGQGQPLPAPGGEPGRGRRGLGATGHREPAHRGAAADGQGRDRLAEHPADEVGAAVRGAAVLVDPVGLSRRERRVVRADGRVDAAARAPAGAEQPGPPALRPVQRLPQRSRAVRPRTAPGPVAALRLPGPRIRARRSDVLLHRGPAVRRRRVLLGAALAARRPAGAGPGARGARGVARRGGRPAAAHAVNGRPRRRARHRRFAPLRRVGAHPSRRARPRGVPGLRPRAAARTRRRDRARRVRPRGHRRAGRAVRRATVPAPAAAGGGRPRAQPRGSGAGPRAAGARGLSGGHVDEGRESPHTAPTLATATAGAA